MIITIINLLLSARLISPIPCKNMTITQVTGGPGAMAAMGVTAATGVTAITSGSSAGSSG